MAATRGVGEAKPTEAKLFKRKSGEKVSNIMAIAAN